MVPIKHICCHTTCIQKPYRLGCLQRMRTTKAATNQTYRYSRWSASMQTVLNLTASTGSWRSSSVEYGPPGQAAPRLFRIQQSHCYDTLGSKNIRPRQLRTQHRVDGKVLRFASEFELILRKPAVLHRDRQRTFGGDQDHAERQQHVDAHPT